jgi:hypothetical protein
MATSHVELYEALRERLGEKAAAMIAEVVPPAGDLATKSDIARVESMIARGFDQLRTLRWILALFLPLWFATWATFLAVLLKH